MNTKIKQAIPLLLITLLILAFILFIKAQELNVIKVIQIILSTILAIIFHVFAHEIGHLIFGLLSKYQFQSFRVFNIIFIKIDNKLIKKKFNIVGTLGQCIMAPPNKNNNTFPYRLYLIGGALMNFLTSLVFCLFFVIFTNAEFIIFPFICIGIYSALLNIIPLNVNVATNDGYHLYKLKNNQEAITAFWNTLKIYSLIIKGTRIKDVPFNLLKPAEDLNNPNSIMTIFSYIDYLIDQHHFEEAKKLVLKTLKINNMNEIHRNELNCHLLFLEIISEVPNTNKINKIYNDKLKKYITASSTQISKQRILYAYEKLIIKNEIKANKILKDFNKTCSTYPILGEIPVEKELIKIVNSLTN